MRRVRLGSLERERNAERDATMIGTRDLARRRRLRERVEDREHRAAVSRVGQALERGIERQDQIAAAHLERAANRGVNGDHAIIFPCRRPF